MKALTTLGITLITLCATTASNAQGSPGDRDIARKHAGCSNAYAEYLERTRSNKDQAARVPAEKLQHLHQQVAVALVGSADAQRLLKSTKAGLDLALAALDQTSGSDPQAVDKFFSKRIDTCTQHINDLTDDQKARVEALPK